MKRIIKNISKIVTFFVGFTLFGFNTTYAFGPLIGALGAGLSALGIVGAKSASATKTLNNVEQVLGYARLFLLFASIVFLLFLFAWAIKKIVTKRANRKLNTVKKLLFRLQSGIVVEKTAALAHGEDIKAEKQEVLAKLLPLLQQGFYKKKIEKKVLQRIVNSLKLIQRGQVTTDEQLVVIEQWLKKFALLAG